MGRRRDSACLCCPCSRKECGQMRGRTSGCCGLVGGGTGSSWSGCASGALRAVTPRKPLLRACPSWEGPQGATRLGWHQLTLEGPSHTCSSAQWFSGPGGGGAVRGRLGAGPPVVLLCDLGQEHHPSGPQCLYSESNGVGGRGADRVPVQSCRPRVPAASRGASAAPSRPGAGAFSWACRTLSRVGAAPHSPAPEAEKLIGAQGRAQGQPCLDWRSPRRWRAAVCLAPCSPANTVWEPARLLGPPACSPHPRPRVLSPPTLPAARRQRRPGCASSPTQRRRAEAESGTEWLGEQNGT